jgi:hypothetical protein
LSTWNYAEAHTGVSLKRADLKDYRRKFGICNKFGVSGASEIAATFEAFETTRTPGDPVKPELHTCSGQEKPDS